MMTWQIDIQLMGSQIIAQALQMATGMNYGTGELTEPVRSEFKNN